MRSGFLHITKSCGLAEHMWAYRRPTPHHGCGSCLCPMPPLIHTDSVPCKVFWLSPNGWQSWYLLVDHSWERHRPRDGKAQTVCKISTVAWSFHVHCICWWLISSWAWPPNSFSTLWHKEVAAIDLDILKCVAHFGKVLTKKQWLTVGQLNVLHILCLYHPTFWGFKVCILYPSMFRFYKMQKNVPWTAKSHTCQIFYVWFGATKQHMLKVSKPLKIQSLYLASMFPL